MKTLKILFAALTIGFLWSCSQSQKTLDQQEQIKTTMIEYRSNYPTLSPSL